MNEAFVSGMRKAGKIAAKVLAETCRHAVAGTTTNELDKIAYDLTLSLGASNACLGYMGYPKSLCTSVNEVLCHGVPDDRKLVDGDILNIDVTVMVDGYYGDTSYTVRVGEVSEASTGVVSAAMEARDAGIRAVRPMGRTGDIGFATETLISIKYPRLDLVENIGGHGIGRVFHGSPFIPSKGRFGTGDLLKPWTCITVEPVVWNGTTFSNLDVQPHPDYAECKIKVPVGKPGDLSAQFEHTVLITDSGYEILTLD